MQALDQIDLPAGVAEEAILAYEEVAVWLGAEGSPLAVMEPSLFPQGSFRLGTPVRPLQGEDFDIDLVCRLMIEKERTTQVQLKALVGDRLKARADLRARLTEHRRCWRLSFAPQFHLDVLPCIPNPDGNEDHILLTDRELRLWQHSNPKGYADWFFDRMRPSLLEQRSVLAKSLGVQVEEVPEWRIRTPLQQAIQLLKRHRDLRFRDSVEVRPVSVIISTLAAKAYSGQSNLLDTVDALVAQMPGQIERRGGRWWVANPAQPEENFADKWNESPERHEAFVNWLRSLAPDLATLRKADQAREGGVLVERLLSPASRTSAVVAAVSRIRKAEDISHAQRPPWPDRLNFTCDVKGAVHEKIRRGASIGPLAQVVSKGRAIKFRARTNTPAPYTVTWQVVNTGPEAREKNQLRGGFDKGEDDSGTVRWEETKYAGTHFIQAFVVRNGELVARSERVPVSII
jgi:hypothetical protein